MGRWAALAQSSHTKRKRYAGELLYQSTGHWQKSRYTHKAAACCRAQQIILRPWQAADAAAVAQAANDPTIAANMRNAFPFPYTQTDAERFLAGCIANEGQGQLTRAIVADGRAVGSVGIFVQQDIYAKSAELGYWLAQDYRGQGIMPQAVRLLCRQAFAEFDLLRIYAEPFAHNAASRRVLEKAGFTCEGIMRNAIYKNGRPGSYCMYALLREELDEGNSE